MTTDITYAFTLDFTHPPKQAETLSYHLGDDFNPAVLSDEFLGMDVELTLTIAPQTEQHLLLTFDYKGVVQVECDRCLAPLEIEVNAEEQVGITLGTALNDEDDEEITLDANDPTYDFSWIAFKLLAINLPSTRVHEDINDCDPEMISRLMDKEPTDTDSTNEAWAELMRAIEKNIKNNN